jgi:hypothetical protein
MSVNGLPMTSDAAIAVRSMATNNGDGFNALVAATDDLLEDHLDSTMSAEFYLDGGGGPDVGTVAVPPPMSVQHNPGSGLTWFDWRQNRDEGTEYVAEYDERT